MKGDLNFKITQHGTAALRVALHRMGRKAQIVHRDVIIEVAEEIYRESLELVPVDTGALYSSGKIDSVFRRANKGWVSISYGTDYIRRPARSGRRSEGGNKSRNEGGGVPTKLYAKRQHNDPTLRNKKTTHQPRAQWKYLITPFNQKKGEVARRTAKHLDAMFNLEMAKQRRAAARERSR